MLARQTLHTRNAHLKAGLERRSIVVELRLTAPQNDLRHRSREAFPDPTHGPAQESPCQMLPRQRNLQRLTKRLRVVDHTRNGKSTLRKSSRVHLPAEICRITVTTVVRSRHRPGGDRTLALYMAPPMASCYLPLALWLMKSSSLVQKKAKSQCIASTGTRLRKKRRTPTSTRQ